MRLAIIDAHDNILLAWPKPADAHADLAEQVAYVLAPGRFRSRRREKLTQAIRAHILELQRETVRL